jgi:hypothetical protein
MIVFGPTWVIECGVRAPECNATEYQEVAVHRPFDSYLPFPLGKYLTYKPYHVLGKVLDRTCFTSLKPPTIPILSRFRQFIGEMQVGIGIVVSRFLRVEANCHAASDSARLWITSLQTDYLVSPIWIQSVKDTIWTAIPLD